MTSTISPVAQQFAEANKSYVANFSAGDVPLPPGRKVAVMTCMDARLIPAAALGLKEGDAHVIRNAGGRTTEALRSLVISQQLLATNEIVVIHHTDCGMLTFSTADARQLVHKQLGLQPGSAGTRTIDSLDFLEFPNLENSVRDDVEFLKASELIKTEKISGWIYEVETGKIRQVV